MHSSKRVSQVVNCLAINNPSIIRFRIILTILKRCLFVRKDRKSIFYRRLVDLPNQSDKATKQIESRNQTIEFGSMIEASRGF